jgi:hypothetical protein
MAHAGTPSASQQVRIEARPEVYDASQRAWTGMSDHTSGDNRRCCSSRQIHSPLANPGTDLGPKDPVAGLSREFAKVLRSAEHWASQVVGLRAWQVE